MDRLEIYPCGGQDANPRGLVRFRYLSKNFKRKVYANFSYADQNLLAIIKKYKTQMQIYSEDFSWNSMEKL